MAISIAGYSGTPLPQKLGIKPGHVVSFLNPPDDWLETLGGLPDAEGSTPSAADKGR